MNLPLDTLFFLCKVFLSVSLFYVWVVRYENIKKEFLEYKLPSWLRDLVGILKVSFSIMILFNDNYESEISAELLRIESPSAEVQGHSKKEKITPLNKKNVSIVNIEKVGNYAIRIIFDDGHDTGIYSWSYLRKVSENNIILYKEYLERVARIKSV